MLLLIDNYDSFTYNIYQILAEVGIDVHVVRNDAMSVQELVALKPERLLISPGPGDPTSAGVSVEAIRHFAGRIPVLGVCLGHQSLAHAYGGDVVRAGRLMHGKVSPVFHDGRGVFTGLPSPFEATRYHSLVIRRDSFTNADFEISAWTEEDEIMGVRHKKWPLHGVQFHPESFLTLEGPKLLRNFVEMKG